MTQEEYLELEALRHECAEWEIKAKELIQELEQLRSIHEFFGSIALTLEEELRSKPKSREEALAAAERQIALAFFNPTPAPTPRRKMRSSSQFIDVKLPTDVGAISFDYHNDRGFWVPIVRSEAPAMKTEESSELFLYYRDRYLFFLRASEVRALTRHRRKHPLKKMISAGQL